MYRSKLTIVLAGVAVLAAPRFVRAEDVVKSPIPGWFLSGGAREHFALAVDTRVVRSGRASGRLSSTDAAPSGTGTIMQRLRADEYRGRRVRFGAWVKTERVTAWSGLWMRVDRPGRKRGAFDNMMDRPIKGSVDWSWFAVVLDIAPDAQFLNFGVLEDGPGTTWIDGARLEIVGENVPVTERSRVPSALANGDFEAPLEDNKVPNWFSSGGAAADYAVALDRRVVHGGRASGSYTPQVPVPGEKLSDPAWRYGTMMQAFRADAYRGKHARASVWVKTVGVTKRGDFWVRAQAEDSPGDGPGLGGGHVKLDPSGDWRRYEIVFDVPVDAFEIDFGVGIGGPGRLWADDATFEVVDRSVPLTTPELPTAPQNLDLEP